MKAPPPGLLDLDAERLGVMADLVAAVEERFRSFGYAKVEPPVIDGADSVLERSGEETRRRVYMFDASDGDELCLRPELTVPVCRLALRAGLPETGFTRLSYAGPVFRHEDPAPGRFRQFTQIGVELIGQGDPVAADAEVIAVALRAAQAAGIEAPAITMGDVRFFLAVLDHFPLPERLKIQLRRDFLRAPGFVDALTRHDETVGEPISLSTDQQALVETVSFLGKERAVRLIESFLSVAEISAIGTRGIDEIVERLIETDSAHLTRLPRDVASQIATFLSIAAMPRTALSQIEAFGKDTGIDFEPLLAEFRIRLDLMDAYGVNPAHCVLRTGLRRDLEYYTGFIFEMSGGSADPHHALGGGGRYDQLLRSLDGNADMGAAGFAFGVERLLLATRPEILTRPLSTREPLHAQVLARARHEAPAAVETAQALRQAGWRVTLDVAEGHEPSVQRTDAPYIIEMESGASGDLFASIRSRSDGTRHVVPLTQIGSFVAKTR